MSAKGYRFKNLPRHVEGLAPDPTKSGRFTVEWNLSPGEVGKAVEVPHGHSADCVCGDGTFEQSAGGMEFAPMRDVEGREIGANPARGFQHAANPVKRFVRPSAVGRRGGIFEINVLDRRG